MEETHYLGDIKDVTLPDEISKILTGELQEVFPYIKDVKLEGTMKYLFSTPFVRKLVWKPKKVTLTLYIDKSFEEEVLHHAVYLDLEPLLRVQPGAAVDREIATVGRRDAVE